MALWRMGLAGGTDPLAAEGVNLVYNNILDDWNCERRLKSAPRGRQKVHRRGWPESNLG